MSRHSATHGAKHVMISLRVWIPLSVGMFVLLGSFGLFVVFEHRRETEEREAFESMARVNAEFMTRTRLAKTSRVAERLSEVIGAQLFFWHENVGETIGPPGAVLGMDPATCKLDGRVEDLADGRMLVGIRGDLGMHWLFVREPFVGGLGRMSRDAWVAMIVFWVLSLAMGLVLSRGVTQPLQLLVRTLPKVGGDAELSELPLARGDEIGSLARALQETHESLRVERQLRRQAERHALLGRMTASMAHEIRNPVSAIRLHAELMDPSRPDEWVDSQRLILSESGRIESLVRQWMNYARPEPPQMVEADMREIVRHAVDVMSPQASYAGVRLVTRLPDQPALLKVDRQRMQQVLGNLILNAVQAMPSGGVVSLTLSMTDDHVVLDVEDEGRGFSDSAMQHFGEPFFSEKEGGMGLGIAVAKDICESHGGVLSAGNHDGGARVSIRLPFDQPLNSES